MVAGTVLSDASTETKQLITLRPSYHGTLNNKNEPRQLIDEDIQQREWTNKLVVYKYRLIRLARLGIRQYKLKTKATIIQNSDDY